MSDWVKQDNGVMTMKVRGSYILVYPNGNTRSCQTVAQLDELINADLPRDSFIKDEPAIIEPLSFVIPGKPLTDNHAYWDQILKNKKTGELYVRRRLTPVGKKYKAIVEAKVREQVARLKPREYIVYIIVYAKWRTKGKGAKSPVEGSDVMRCEKLLIDSIYDTLMPDEYRSDKWIWIITLEKRHEPDKAKHRAVVTIRPWGDVERQGGLW